MRKEDKTPKISAKQAAVVEDLRRKIVAGVLEPDSQLPTRSQLLDQYQVSMTTVQGALDRLTADGFVVARGRAGTFVSRQPPHLCNYALVFYSHAGAWGVWGGAWQALSAHAANINRAGGHRRIHQYFDVHGHSDEEDHQRLLRDVRAQRLAGVIFASPISELADSPLFTDPSVRRVVMGGNPSPGNDCAVIKTNFQSMFDLALEHLLARGRRRIAVLMKSGALSAHESEPMLSAFAGAGLPLPPRWRQYVDVFDPLSVSHAVQILLDAKQHAERPDGLIIGDDTMIDSAIAGVMVSGARVPEELDLVAQANFPISSRLPLPVWRVGFDSRRILDAAIQAIDAQRRAGSASAEPQLMNIDAVSQADVEPAPDPARVVVVVTT